MIPVIDAVLNIGSKVIDRVWPDPEERAKAKLKLLELQQSGEFKELEAAMQVVVTEAKSEHWLTSTWRPITMLVLVAIVANNYILAPYIQLILGVDAVLELPPFLWEMLKIGLGGYVVGRSVEKVASVWKEKK